MRRVDLLKVLPDELPEGAIAGLSTYGEASFGSEASKQLFEGIRAALWPKGFEPFSTPTGLRQRNDVQHLTTHTMHRRDFFVTDDRYIWNSRKSLAKLGIQIVLSTEARDLARAACQGAGASFGSRPP